MPFENRQDAGRRLAVRLKDLALTNPIVLAIPRGGVVVGYEVAVVLDAPLDVIVPRKIGAPQQPELAIGAIAGKDIRVLDNDAIRYLHVSQEFLDREIRAGREEIARREAIYRRGSPFPDLQDMTAILVMTASLLDTPPSPPRAMSGKEARERSYWRYPSRHRILFHGCVRR